MTDTATAEAPVAEAEEKPARVKKVAVATPCACQFYTGKDSKGEELSTGCDGENVRTFLPGHDAKLKSLLIKTAVAGNPVRKSNEDGTEFDEMDPLHAAEEYGFRNLVEKSVEAAKAKADARESRLKAREEKRAAAAKLKEEAKAKRDLEAKRKKAHATAVEEAAEARKSQPGPATAKVGRNKFDGEILADGTFKYLDAQGKEQETTTYTVVIDPASVPVPDVEA